MNLRTGSILASALGLITLLVVLGACISSADTAGMRTATSAPQAADSRVPSPPDSPDGEETSAPPPAEWPEEPPLLRVSGTVSDDQGQSLDIAVTITNVALPTNQDLRDLEAAWCQPMDSTPFRPDTRIVTLSVLATSPGGFAGWSDDRGIDVYGDVFYGSIWKAPPHSPGACIPHSKVFRPGSGTVKVLASSEYWSVEAPVDESSAATLAMYGFRAVTHDALGQRTGTRLVSCLPEPSQEFARLAAVASLEIPWTEAIWSDQCGHGRLATDY